ncbi:MAG: type II secretion system F family protein [Armatimonadia bacterium]
MLWALRLSERARLFRELATLVNSGMSLGMALSALEDRPQSAELRAIVQDAAQKVSRGKRFSEIMKAYPHVFSELNVALIAAGEEGGHLDTMLKTCAEYLERDLEFQQNIARETFYPKILIGAVFLIPLGAKMLIALLTGSPVAAFVIGLKFFASVLVVAAVAFGLYVALRRYNETETGRRNIDQFKLHTPLIGPVIMRLAWARLSRALAALYGAGVSIRSSVEIAARTAGNRIISRAVMASVPALERGEKLSDALARTGQMPPLAMSMLRTGELTGGIDETMVKVADYFEAEAFTSVKKMTIMIMPISIITIGIVVLFMLLNMYGGYFSQFTE